MDQLEKNLSTKGENSIFKYLFGGSTESLIECRNIEYKSVREENFIDIQLSLKSGLNNFTSLHESLLEFLQKEPLDGENQYATDGYGKQDADKRVRFKKLPKVLMFHLRRCEFDYHTETNQKIKHKFEFPEEIDMNQYKDIDLKKEGNHNYKLFGIFVHHGTDGLAGHYTVYLKTDNIWTEFDDEMTKTVDWEYVKEKTYGGKKMEVVLTSNECTLNKRYKKSISHAYMLIYIEEESIQQILNCEHSPKKLEIRNTLKSLCHSPNQMPQEKWVNFLEKCYSDKSIQKLFETIQKSNYEDLLKKVKEIYLMSPLQILGEPTALGPLSGLDFQNENPDFQNKRNLFFKKFINNFKLKDILIKQTTKTISKENIENIENKVNDFLSNTPDYLNIYPGITSNILLDNLHVVPFELLTNLKDSFIPFDEIFSNNHDSSLNISFKVSIELSLLSFKKHLLSIMFSSSYKKLFGLNFLEFDKNLFHDKQNKNYLDFNLVSSNDLDRILNLFDFYNLNFENTNPLEKMDLNFETKFIDIVYRDRELYIIPIPKNFTQINLNSLLPESFQSNTNIHDIRETPNKILMKMKQSNFYKYNFDQIFSTNVLIPILPDFKILDINKNLVPKYSKNLNFNQNLKFLLSLEEQDNNNTHSGSICFLIKVYNPYLNLYVNHSYIMINKMKDNFEFINSIRKQTKINDFFMFIEKIDFNYHNNPIFVLFHPAHDSFYNNYWDLFKKIVHDNLNVPLFSSNSSALRKMNDSSIHNIYIIPSIVSLFPKLNIKFSENVDSDSMENNQKRKEDNNIESKETRKINSEDAKNDIIKKPAKEFKLCCLFLDISILATAYDWIDRFRNLFSFHVQDVEFNKKRSLFFKENLSPSHLKTLLFFRMYKEFMFFERIVKNQNFINGHFFYGNNFNNSKEFEVNVNNIQDIVTPAVQVDSIKVQLWYGKRKKWVDDTFKIDLEDEINNFSDEVLNVYKPLKQFNFKLTSTLAGNILQYALRIASHFKSIEAKNETIVPLPKNFKDDITQIILEVQDLFDKRWNKKKNLSKSNIIYYIFEIQNDIFCKLNLKKQEFYVEYAIWNTGNPLIFEMNIPDDTFFTKAQLLSKMALTNTSFFENLVKDELNSSNYNNNLKYLKWCNNLEINKFSNYKSENSDIYNKDLDNLEEYTLTKEDLEDSFKNYKFEQMFEFYRLDIFTSNLAYKMVYFIKENFDNEFRKNVPRLLLSKIIGLKPSFLVSLLHFYNKYRSPNQRININKYLKILRRMRKDSLNLISFLSNNNNNINEEELGTVSFNEKYPFFKMVVIFVTNNKDELTCSPRFLLLPSELIFAEVLPIISTFMFGIYKINYFKNKDIIDVMAFNGTFEFAECENEELQGEYQEDNMIKIVYKIVN